MNARLSAARRALGYLVHASVGHGAVVLLALAMYAGWQLTVRAWPVDQPELPVSPGVAVVVDEPVTTPPPPALLAVAVFVVCIPLIVILTRWSARWEMGAAGALLDRAVPAGAHRDGHTWRALTWAPLQLSVGLALLVVALAPAVPLVYFGYVLLKMTGFLGDPPDGPIGPEGFVPSDYYVYTGAEIARDLLVAGGALVVAVPWLLFLTPVLARLQARLTYRVLTSRTAALEQRVGELAETRAGAVDAHTAELRRIERDLHDGMQAQLVNVAMRLGMAERRLVDEPAAVGALLVEARTCTEEAMSGLRDVLRTMYPPVLADRGLRGALLGLAARNVTATTVDMPDLDDLPAPVEAAAYFIVAEALTNVTKHSAASHADVTVRREPQALLVEVTDNGLGGADETRGTGIVGMRRRVAALDGWLEVTSAAGGPTVVIAELPCGS